MSNSSGHHSHHGVAFSAGFFVHKLVHSRTHHRRAKMAHQRRVLAHMPIGQRMAGQAIAEGIGQLVFILTFAIVLGALLAGI